MEFTFYWLNGDIKTLTGDTVEQAFNTCYGGGAIKALDFYEVGQPSGDYEFNTSQHAWDRKVPII